MSKNIEVKMPKLGESIVSAKIVQWLKGVGESVEVDEPLVEVATDKVNSEIPSPVKGVITSIIAQVDEEYEIDSVLCEIQADGAPTSELAKKEESKSHAAPQPSEPTQGNMQDYYSPAVLRLAKERNIPMSQLESIPRSGAEGRLTKKDIEAFTAKKPASVKSHDVAQSVVERIKMTQMRKAIAENMVKSFYQAPHASLVTKVDITNVMEHIQKHKQAFFEKHGFKLTITSFIAKAIALAVQEFPFINASLEEDTIVLKRFVNLGIAVSVDQAIMVPVMRNCENKSLVEIAKEVSVLSQKARENNLKPDDVQEGTITMSNFGMSGTLIGIPIIRFPEVAIIGIGAIEKQVVPLKEGTSIGIRDQLHISLTFDHRALDGMYGCGFLQALKKHLENFDLSLGL